MDRYTWLPMGRRRPWLIGSQTAIVASLLIAAANSPAASDTAIVIGIVLSLSILTAVQDVALDALVVDLTPAGEMGRMNGFMFGGKVFGIAGGMAITSYLLEYHGFSIAMLGMIAFFVIPGICIVFIRERDGEKLLPWSNGIASQDAKALVHDDWAAILLAAFRNLFRRQTLLVGLLLLTYGIHQNLNDTTDSLFVIKQLGWSQSESSFLAAVFNILVGIFCLTLGGWIVDKFGPGRIAFWSGVSSMIIMSAYLFDEALWQSDALFMAWYGLKTIPLFLFYLCNLVLAMRVAAPETAATSLSVLFSIGTLGFVIASALLPALESLGGYQAMYGASAVLIFVAGLITLSLSKEVRQPA